MSRDKHKHPTPNRSGRVETLPYSNALFERLSLKLVYTAIQGQAAIYRGVSRSYKERRLSKHRSHQCLRFDPMHCVAAMPISIFATHRVNEITDTV